jgi:hypothetical protein
VQELTVIIELTIPQETKPIWMFRIFEHNNLQYTSQIELFVQNSVKFLLFPFILDAKELTKRFKYTANDKFKNMIFFTSSAKV